MKKFISLILSLLIYSNTALACDQVRVYYATSSTVDFCLWTLDATVGAVKNESAAHAAGDTYVMKDEGAEASTTNGFTDEGSCYSIVLTATETTAARVLLNIEDQGTKTWADACVSIQTIARTAADNGLAYYSFPTTDLVSIDGQATSGNNATLNLKKLNIVNSAGDALVASSTGSNGNGAAISGNGTGSGLKTTAGATGQGGFDAIGGATSGRAISATNTSGTVVSFISSGGNGVGFNATGNGTGAGIAATAGATADAIKLNAGATSGDAIHATVVFGDGFDGTINGSITGSLSGSIGSFGAGAISASSFSAGAIDASAIAANAIGASELAADAGTELGTANWVTTTRQLTGLQVFDNTGTWTGNLSGSVGSVGPNGISNGSFAVGAIDASAVAANTIGASELATDAAAEIASSVGSISLGAGAITSATFATGAIDANAIATNAIGGAEIAPGAITVSEAPNLDAAISSISGGGGSGTDEISSGIAQSVTLSTIRFAAVETYTNNVLSNNVSAVITDASTGKGQVRCIKSNVGSTDTATLVAPWTIVPSGIVHYSLRATPNCNPALWHTE